MDRVIRLPPPIVGAANTPRLGSRSSGVLGRYPARRHPISGLSVLSDDPSSGGERRRAETLMSDRPFVLRIAHDDLVLVKLSDTPDCTESRTMVSRLRHCVAPGPDADAIRIHDIPQQLTTRVPFRRGQKNEKDPTSRNIERRIAFLRSGRRAAGRPVFRLHARTRALGANSVAIQQPAR